MVLIVDKYDGSWSQIFVPFIDSVSSMENRRMSTTGTFFILYVLISGTTFCPENVLAHLKSPSNSILDLIVHDNRTFR